MLYLLFAAYALVIVTTSYVVGLRLIRTATERSWLESTDEPLLSATALGFLTFSLLGYVTFYVYFVDARLGYAASVLCLVTTVGLTLHFWTSRRFRHGRQHLTPILLLFLSVGIFYLACTNLYVPSEPSHYPVSSRFLELPGDHNLPREVGAMLRKGEFRSPFHDRWQVSDRPPLQAGFYLLMTLNNVPAYYQAVSTVLQCFWLVGMLWLVRSLGFDRRTANMTVLVGVFSGFFLLHTVYTWPKLLAAAHFLFALSYFLRFLRCEKRGDIYLSGLCLAAAGLSHTGVVLTMPCFLLLFTEPRFWKHSLVERGKTLAVWAACALVPMIPWILFQKLIDPPGTQLSVMHLTTTTDLRTNLIAAFTETYWGLGFTDWLQGRLVNLGTTLSLGLTDNLVVLRRAEFFYVLAALGNLPLLLAPYAFLHFTGKNWPSNPFLLRLLLGLALAFGLWLLLMINPGSAIIHQGSLASMSLVYLLFGVIAARLWQKAGWCRAATVVVLVSQVARFVAVWLVAPPAYPTSGIDPVALVMLVSCASLVAFQLLRRPSELADC